MKFQLIFVCCLYLLCCSASSKFRVQGTTQTPDAPPGDDLSRRLEAAIEARNSGDPVAIGQASKRVIALALAEMAKLRLDAKAYAEAINLCGESLEFEDTAETRIEMAIASLYARKLSEAVKQASSAAEIDSQNALAWTIKGEALLESEDYPHAASALNNALKIKPDAESAYALGVAQLGMGEKQEAADSFSQFFALVGDAGWSRVLVGRAYHEHALTQEAEMQFQKALLLDPSVPNAHYFWAISLMQGNGWSANPEVYSHLQAELQINPRHFEANYMMGSLASIARNYTESDRYLRLAAEIKPSVPETWVLLGINAQSRKNTQSAEAYFRKAIKLVENSRLTEHFEIRKAYIGLGRLLVASGKTREGEEFLNKARDLQAQSLAESRKRIAGVKGQDEERDAAPYIPESDSDRRPSLSPPSTRVSGASKSSSSTTETISRSPSEPEGKTEKRLKVVLGASFNDLATAEALQEKYQQAFNHYREAARWDSQIPGLQRNLGLAAQFAGQPAEAIRLLSKVVAQTPGDEHARAVLGLAYFAARDFAKTTQTIAPIANRALQDPQLGFAWAKSLSQTGNKRAAIRALQRLEESGANLSAQDLIQFAKLWQELGNSERANQSFRRALAIDPENAEAKCALHLSECP